MTQTAIKVEGLAKSYRIARALGRQPYRTLQEEVIELPKTLWKRAMGRSDTMETFWALEDVSFEVKEGEVVGIIGRNGAGKSTLLKILSRITEPTRGRAEIFGRVGALLEVGTGFHPELTGRENIFLSGAILGMRKSEIARQFDAIVDFAEVEQFIDTPTKRYSSGMYTRLAFAVAAHLEPEILLVDEVLAVGDAAFQKKCLGKMEEVSGEGRTVFFVSHNTQAVRQLCTRGILLEHGRVAADGPTDSTLAVYNQKLRELKVDAETGVNNPENRRGSGAVRFTSVSVEDLDGNERYTFSMGDTVRFRLSFDVHAPMRGLAIFVGLRSGLSRELITSARHVLTDTTVQPGTSSTVVVDLPEVYIRPGEYPLYLHVSEALQSPRDYDVLDDLTPPLVIVPGTRIMHDNFDPSRPLGVFSLPSRIMLEDPEAGFDREEPRPEMKRPQIVR
ncbi:MAG TPA: ABC transporter ATP-binding protein [Gemmatimonadaceae bacterium]|nr:ABC transporter ATP-binding protein [Gemmatimonadaceae bacterium]